MKSPLDKYHEIVRGQLDAVAQNQKQNMETAAQWVATALLDEGYVYAFGSGHSHALAEEVFYRAGGLARVIPILDPRLMVHESATGSSEWERKEGLAEEIFVPYKLGACDVLFIISNSGRNAVPIEMAMEGRKRGAKVIAVTSAQYNGAYASRHSSGKNLAEIADLVIDNHGVAGDATLSINGINQRMGPVSTITSAFILNGILAEAATRVVAAGGLPEVWGSANSDSANNNILHGKYKGRIPHL